jgi:SAM-dependent methyltransferase
VRDTTHEALVLDQFTRQASPFAAAAMITDERALRLIVEAARAASDDTVLDVACGPGLVVCAFAPHVRKATGIDATPAMLDRARELAAGLDARNIAWDQGDAYSLPYADGSFTVVVTRYSLHHLLDPTAALREMVRACAPGGRVVVVDAYAPEDPAKAAAYNEVERLRDPSHARSLSLAELKGLFGRVGLPEPRTTLYELPVEVQDLLARAFPDPGDDVKIVEALRASAADGRLGIAVRVDGDKIHVSYRAAILVANRPDRHHSDQIGDENIGAYENIRMAAPASLPEGWRRRDRRRRTSPARSA